jgi:hypothetical protein
MILGTAAYAAPAQNWAPISPSGEVVRRRRRRMICTENPSGANTWSELHAEVERWRMGRTKVMRSALQVVTSALILGACWATSAGAETITFTLGGSFVSGSLEEIGSHGSVDEAAVGAYLGAPVVPGNAFTVTLSYDPLAADLFPEQKLFAVYRPTATVVMHTGGATRLLGTDLFVLVWKASANPSFPSADRLQFSIGGQGTGSDPLFTHPRFGPISFNMDFHNQVRPDSPLAIPYLEDESLPTDPRIFTSAAFNIVDFRVFECTDCDRMTLAQGRILSAAVTPNSIVTPEPSSLALFGSGVVAVAVRRWRRHRK